MKSICWLRRDLRLSDHHALYEATKQSEETVLVFVFDKIILSKLKDRADRRLTFILESLKEIENKLKDFNSRLVILHGDPVVEIPKLAKTLGIEAVYTNEDYETYAKKRDLEVKEKLNKAGVQFFTYKDHVIFSGSEILKADNTPYRVFTPYKTAWLKTLRKDHVASFNPDLNKLMSGSKLKNIGSNLDYSEVGFHKSDLSVMPGISGALKAFSKFQKSIDKYDQLRNFPTIDVGTSQLSTHLRFGTISIRELVRWVMKHPSAGSKVWLSELIWRDFYQMILDRYPHVEKEAFLSKYKNIKWVKNKKYFQAWCEGKTGFPIVDAAMRQLNTTGWMHNRLRMVVASFLVKDLLIDWRKGEQYFAEKLLDFDLASNNGGWQWCASTGCDAQPYFRIFNPITQSTRFDVNGDFIRKWVPELREINDKDIHFPAEAKPQKLPPKFVLGKSYPEPIVDHSDQRDKAIDLYRNQ